MRIASLQHEVAYNNALHTCKLYAALQVCTVSATLYEKWISYSTNIQNAVIICATMVTIRRRLLLHIQQLMVRLQLSFLALPLNQTFLKILVQKILAIGLSILFAIKIQSDIFCGIIFLKEQLSQKKNLNLNNIQHYLGILVFP